MKRALKRERARPARARAAEHARKNTASPRNDADRNETERAETELLSRLRRGEEDAFEALVRDASAPMLVTARHVLGRSESAGGESAARAAVEEAFATAFASLENMPERTTLSAWLQRLTVRSALRKRREMAAHPDPVLDALLPRFTAHGNWADGPRRWIDPDAQLSDRSRAIVRECVDALPELDREVFLLREVEGMDAASVAAELDVDETDVKLSLHRARRELKGLLEKRLDLAA
jgi:RNA polymerase sigma-70 factor (ECF subfamily)